MNMQEFRPYLAIGRAIIFVAAFAPFAALGQGDWFVKDAADGAQWERINGSCVEILRGGHFNEDKITDVFTAYGGKWRVSFGGRTPWQVIATSGIGMKDLRLGDFNGDEITDIFTTWGGQWRISYSGSSQWIQAASSGFDISELRFGDVDSSGTTDVVAMVNGTPQMSSGAMGQWTPIPLLHGEPLPGLYDLNNGNFVGDARKDSFRSDTSNCTDESSNEVEPHPEPNQMVVCGLMCPRDFHISRYNHRASCETEPDEKGETAELTSEVLCVRNGPTEFKTCGLQCPTGYEVKSVNKKEQKSFSAACDPNNPPEGPSGSLDPNQVTCVPVM